MSSHQDSSDSTSMSLRFWGVRGSIPCAGPDTLKYGGNTACIEIRCGQQILIFDAGTGIRLLGQFLEREHGFADINLFLSHYHIDHIMGLPFFAPLYSTEYAVSLWGAHSEPKRSVELALRKLMNEPLFPVQIGDLRARLEFRDFRAGDTLKPSPDIAILTAPLHHPGGATGYRIEYAGKNIAYLSDTEFPDGVIDPGILALARNADLVVLDTTYTDQELPIHRGWGHASWQQGVQLANRAKAKRLCLFHHDPSHDDAFMDTLAKEADGARSGTIVAYEGLRIDL